MTNAELAKSLNLEFELGGVDAITTNVIRQWVLWGLLNRTRIKGRAPGGGPVWDRDPVSLNRVRRLAQLRKMGVRGKHLLIAQAYLEWGHDDFELVKEAFRHEFRRIRRKTQRGLTSDVEFDAVEDLGVTRKRALRKQSGPLDQRFVGTKLEQSPELYLSALNLMVAGTSANDQFLKFAEVGAQQILPSEIWAISPQIAETLMSVSAGMLSDPEEKENSHEDNILSSSQRDFRLARLIIRRMGKFAKLDLKGLGIPDIDPNIAYLQSELISLQPAFSIGTWAITQFVAALKLARDPKNPIAIFGAQIPKF